MITIATFNVNSIKARLPNLLAWLDVARPDIVLLQELKCVDEAFPAMEIEERGYNIASHGQKTYNGVAILSKFPLDDVVRGLPETPPPIGGKMGGGPMESMYSDSAPHLTSPRWGEETDPQARYIEAVVSIKCGAIRVASVYVPNGQDVGSDKFPYKLNFLERLRAHWVERLTYHEVAVLGGDFNVAPAPIDVYDHAALDGSVCYHPLERARLSALMHLGLYDAFRVANPTKQQFSWWDYRSGGYDRGHGLRIDHLLLSPMAADALAHCIIDETPRGQEKPSDHAPVIATLAC
jgi:exodeoxyribonuclease-3